METKKGKALVTQGGTTMTIQGQGRAERERESDVGNWVIFPEVCFQFSFSSFIYEGSKKFPASQTSEKFTHHVYVYIKKKLQISLLV